MILIRSMFDDVFDPIVGMGLGNVTGRGGMSDAFDPFVGQGGVGSIRDQVFC